MERDYMNQWSTNRLILQIALIEPRYQSHQHEHRFSPPGSARCQPQAFKLIHMVEL